MLLECSYMKRLWPKTDEEAQKTENRICLYHMLDESGQRVEFVAKGKNLPTDSNLLITFTGEFVGDPRGDTFKVDTFTTAVRRSRASVLDYLSSGAIKGGGSKIAKRIVDCFGIDAITILEENPERLMEVNGIGPAVLEEIKESFYENREVHNLMKYLGQFNISINKAQRIVDKFGNRALEVVRQDLFHLCAVDGFGFITVDEIAYKMRYPLKTYPRVLAACEYLLMENRQDGHLFMNSEDYLKGLQALLNKNKDGIFRFTQKELIPIVQQALQESEKIVCKNYCIYLKRDFQDESIFASLMAERLIHEKKLQKNVVPFPRINGSDISLSPEQEEAVKTALMKNTVIITGGPGTGKTTTLRTFLECHKKLYPQKKRILLCAPTGLASRRLGEATGMESHTIHKGFFILSDDDELSLDDTEGFVPYDVVIMDESSMVDQ